MASHCCVRDGGKQTRKDELSATTWAKGGSYLNRGLEKVPKKLLEDVLGKSVYFSSYRVFKKYPRRCVACQLVNRLEAHSSAIDRGKHRCLG